MFTHQFNLWLDILKKGENFSRKRKIDPLILVNARLAPDMYPLARQIQIGTDMVRKGMGRLASIDAPSYEDNEVTFGDLQKRIEKTIHFLETITEEQLQGSESKTIHFSIRDNEFDFHNGVDYLTRWIITHFFFHMTTCYNILRSNGVNLGKLDFVKV
tara:strand:+ start:63 stop:536 length:474 start_codon:yes stop_codon:yes gene_type:complete